MPKKYIIYWVNPGPPNKDSRQLWLDFEGTTYGTGGLDSPSETSPLIKSLANHILDRGIKIEEGFDDFTTISAPTRKFGRYDSRRKEPVSPQLMDKFERVYIEEAKRREEREKANS